MALRQPYKSVIKKTSSLIPYSKNARTHSSAQVDQIAKSIREFGFTNPVLIDENDCVIAGHGRLLAAEKLKLTEVPAVIVSGLSETQKRALILADNRLALSAGWDDDLLKLELQALNADGYDMALTGFDQKELEQYLTFGMSEGNTDPDETPELPSDPITRPGDTWILGAHRLRCGDSTKATDVEALLQGVKPHLMVTDPPYGVEYSADWRNDALAGKVRANGKKEGGGRATGKVMNDDKADWREAWALFPGNIAYVWHAGNMAGPVQESLISCEFSIRAQIIWVKNHFAIGRGDYHWQHEPCWYAVKDKGNWTGDRKQTTIWQIDKPQKSETGHSTQKPVECMKRPIENNSSPGQAIYEPFSGSGTTIIAAEMTGRSCYAMELNPAYVDMAVKRWENFTGKKAVLEGSEDDGRAKTTRNKAPGKAKAGSTAKTKGKAGKAK